MWDKLFKDSSKEKKDISSPISATGSVPSFLKPGVSVSTEPTSNTDIDPRIIEVLDAAMNTKNPPGYDYYEFSKTLDELKNTITDDSIRFVAAFAAAKALKVTREKLLTSSDYYIRILDEELAKFERELQTKSKEIESKKSQLKATTDKIAELLQTVEQLQQQKVSIESSISEELQKTETVKVAFHHSVNVVKTRISSDKEKIQQYLK